MTREITDKNEWNKLLAQAPEVSGKFLQSWEWGEFQESAGRRIRRFAGDGCLAQVVEMPLPGGGRFWLCPKGPLAATGEILHIRRLLIGLREEARRSGAVFLRFEPQDAADLGAAGRGLRPAKHVSPSHTSIIDISKSEEEILAAMHQKTRYNIRVAEKHGVAVGPWSGSFDEVHGLFSETARRDGFRLHPRAYYEAQLKMPNVAAYGATHGGKLLAAAIVIFDGEMATYLHGASSNESRNLMAPYALHWSIIKEAKKRGCRRYDLWGISDDPESGWAGITRFKRGWGGYEAAAPGTFDLPVSRFWYSVYRLARRLRP